MRKFNKTVSSLVIVVLMGTVSNVNAQNWLTAGNALSGGEKLGSTTAQPVDFYTNNTRQGTITSNGLWGIGTNGTTPLNKLLVENGIISGSPYPGLNLDNNHIDESWLGILSVSTNNNDVNIAVMGYAPDTLNFANIGIAGKAMGGRNTNAMGLLTEVTSLGTGLADRCAGVNATATGGVSIHAGYFDAIAVSGTEDNKAVDGRADGGGNTIIDGNIGVDGNAVNSYNSLEIGVRGIAGYNSAGVSHLAYGVYGEAHSASGTARAGFFNGDVFYSGALVPSDSKLKQNIRNYDNALEQIGQLNVKQYTFKNEEFSYMHLPEGNQVGLLSAELKKVFPNLVKKTVAPKTTILRDEKGRPKIKTEQGVEFDAVNYTALIPVLIQGVKELHQKVGDLEKQNSELAQKNNDLEKLLDKLCSSGCGGFAPSTAPADNTTGQNQLFQNIPNPFGQTTEIGYFLEASAQEAFIVITDMKGTVLKRFDGLAQGSGKIKVAAESFAGGVYNYSLYANGTLIDTKKMVTAVKH